MFSLAIVAEDDSKTDECHGTKEAGAKLLFLIPFFNIYHVAYEIQRIQGRGTLISQIYRNIGSIVVISNSLPPALRRHLR